jgi:hypothetical protein
MMTTGTSGLSRLTAVLEDVDPVHAAVLEPDIEDHQPRRGLVQLGHASSDVPARRVV